MKEKAWSGVRRALPAIRLLGFVAALAIIVVMAAGAARDVELREIAWWPLPLALVGAATWWLLGARGWAVLLTGRARREDMSVWCRTQALRYLPGGLWAPASRAVVISGRLLDRISTVATDNAIALCAAASVGSAALALSGDPRWLPLAAVVAVPYSAARLLAGRVRVDPARALRATWNYVVAFVAYCAAAVLVQAAVSGFDDPVTVAGAAALAWCAGFVVVIAPSGVGVRELAYVALLGGVLPTAEVTAAAVAMRLVMILAELAVLVVVGRPSALRQLRPTSATQRTD